MSEPNIPLEELDDLVDDYIDWHIAELKQARIKVVENLLGVHNNRTMGDWQKRARKIIKDNT